MNIVGVLGPKILSLLMVLCAPVSLHNKIFLVTIWLIKLIIDFDVAKPGKQGKMYRWMRNMEHSNRELIVTCIQCVPSIVFLMAAIKMSTGILLIPGVIAVLVHLALIIGCIKDILDERKRKNRK